ncbi:MAG: CPBP family intramembrane metalloprotease [Cyclobacteriaceae bacterium]|nr:CPBP family intramembrane metalloprotease [Cyclobacteriaceae bacterium]
MKIFLNQLGKIREAWWVAIFFLVLAALTLPAIFLSRSNNAEVSIYQQAIIVLAATWICQRLWGGSFADLTGRLDLSFVRNLFAGLALGAALMLAPSLVLYVGGWVRWEGQSADAYSLWAITGTMVAGAVSEEFLFRGFIFGRLRGSLGTWPAQVIISAYFLLTHMANPEMHGTVKILAMANIFLASILFGLTVIRTNNLVMAIAMHTAANWVQGVLLGFGVSGHVQPSLLLPVFGDAPLWLTGGNFGLEGSALGLAGVVVLAVAVGKWKGNH